MMDTESMREQVLDLLVCGSVDVFLHLPCVFALPEVGVPLLLDHLYQLHSRRVSFRSLVGKNDDLFPHGEHTLQVLVDDVVHDVVGAGGVRDFLDSVEGAFQRSRSVAAVEVKGAFGVSTDELGNLIIVR